jgi:hypothetical protein
MTERYIQHLPQFRVYNRERELARRERERKESAWEQELLQAMGASDPAGFQHPSRENHKVSVCVPSNDTTADVPRAGSLDTSERRQQEESKSRVYVSTVAPNVRADGIGIFKRRDETWRRHSDQSNKGTAAKILPLVRNKTVAATCEDHMPHDNIDQYKYDILGKKLGELGIGSPGREPGHTRSCPKLFNTEQAISNSPSSSKPSCHQNVQEENVTCRNQQKDCGMPTGGVSLHDSYKCQIANKDSKNYFGVQDESVDNGHQNQNLAYNIHTQMSDSKKSVKKQGNIKEHSIHNNILSNDHHIHGPSIDQNLSQCQGSCAVSNQILNCNKPGSSSSDINST